MAWESAAQHLSDANVTLMHYCDSLRRDLGALEARVDASEEVRGDYHDKYLREARRAEDALAEVASLRKQLAEAQGALAAAS